MMIKNVIYETALRYVECKVFGKKFNIPYMINQKDRYCSPLTKGKAPIEEIIQEFKIKAKQNKLKITELNSDEIKQTMQSYGLGIDCSGFAYHIINPYVKQKTGKYLDQFLIRFPEPLGQIDKFLFKDKRYKKISAAQLTSNLNTVEITDVSKIRIGDIVRMTHQGYEGKHPLVIMEVTPTYLLYAHSSEYVETNGTHFGKILIRNSKKGLEKQDWLERTVTGKNYGENAFRVDLGDSVRRLMCLNI